MLFRSNPGSGVPVYLQLIEQVKHAIDVGALVPGDQLPAIRRVAEDLVINPNTVAKAYRELEHDGVIELRQGSGAFVSENGRAGRVARVTNRAAGAAGRAGAPDRRGAHTGGNPPAVRGRAIAAGRPAAHEEIMSTPDLVDRDSRAHEAIQVGAGARPVSTCTCRAARSTASSAATAPARPRRSRR